ncbi:REST corepressor 2-like [Scaptodrosophila lebanonensis]|uniref:REST corepressor 2-like n=1 Tax=Drosophila lebanonensis TaxID=7225 RepID=A0A6J2U779_DROLE|nr:REST corepressor 2-like [Scaptodrosophila lebanonensis]
MSGKERPRSLRLQQYQKEQQQKQEEQYFSSGLVRFSSVRFKVEPPFALDMDDDGRGYSVQHLTPPRQHALRTRMRGYVDKVDIGPEHQVEVPDYEPVDKDKPYRDSAVETLLWAPSGTASDSRLTQYMTVATRTNNYTVEQAIFMLQAHRHNYRRALQQVSHYANIRALWSTSEQQRFELLLARHGTRFNRIKEAMPWRGLAELLDFYYSWVPAQNELSYPQQFLTWLELTVPMYQRSNYSGVGGMFLSRSKAPVLPSPLLPQVLQQAPPPPLENGELLALARANTSAWQCADFMRQMGLLQAQLLKQRSQLENKDANWLEDWDELRRALKTGGTRNFREWRQLDKQLLELALEEYGCNFALISRILRSKTEQQVRQYYETNMEVLRRYAEAYTGKSDFDEATEDMNESFLYEMYPNASVK